MRGVFASAHIASQNGQGALLRRNAATQERAERHATRARSATSAAPSSPSGSGKRLPRQARSLSPSAPRSRDRAETTSGDRLPALARRRRSSLRRWPAKVGRLSPRGTARLTASRAGAVGWVRELV